MRIKIDPKGDLFGVVQIVSNATIGREYKYELKVGSGRRNVSFKDAVCSRIMIHQSQAPLHYVCIKFI